VLGGELCAVVTAAQLRVLLLARYLPLLPLLLLLLLPGHQQGGCCGAHLHRHHQL
jgi:hypothetical protein